MVIVVAMSVWLSLGAAPVVLSSPALTELGGCVKAACAASEAARVCKCLPAEAGAAPALTVDRGGAHLELDVRAWQGAVDDFWVVEVDLDGDRRPELVIASLAQEALATGIRTYDVAIVDGATEEAIRALAQDWGPEAVSSQHLLFTEWERRAGGGLVFVGREFAYQRGRLEPTRAPVLRRTMDAAFERERHAEAHGLVRWLANAATTKGQDEPPRGLISAVVKGVTSWDAAEVHLEGPKGLVTTLTQGGERELRLGDLRARRLFPVAHWPLQAGAWLVGRAVKVARSGDALAGPVWLDGSAP